MILFDINWLYFAYIFVVETKTGLTLLTPHFGSQAQHSVCARLACEDRVTRSPTAKRKCRVWIAQTFFGYSEIAKSCNSCNIYVFFEYMDFDAEEQASEHGIRNGSILETHKLGHSSCFPSGWRWHFSHHWRTLNSNRRSLKQWPGGGSWIWVQVPPDHCSNALVLWLKMCSSVAMRWLRPFTVSFTRKLRWNCWASWEHVELLLPPKPGQPQVDSTAAGPRCAGQLDNEVKLQC